MRRRTLGLLVGTVALIGAACGGGSTGADTGADRLQGDDGTAGDEAVTDPGSDAARPDAFAGDEGGTADPGAPEDVPADGTGTDDATADPGIPGDATADVAMHDAADAGDAATGWDLPAHAPGGCGAAVFDWLPADQVGKVVSVEEDAQWQQPPEVLDALLAQAGFSAFSPLPYGSRLYRMRYVTQDHGVTREATALVGVPQPVDGSAGAYPTALWLHGTTGFNDGCAPSLGLDGAAGAVVMAALGFVGVAPDYLGMNGWGAASEIPHPYMVGEPTAIASLDAVRAARAFLADGTIPDEPGRADDRIIPWGGSQGGHAALWVDRLAGYYAPELRVAATVALIPPADLRAEAQAALASVVEGTGGVAAFLAAAMRWYGLPPSLAGVLTDVDPTHFVTALPAAMDTQCRPDHLFDGVTSVDQIYEPDFIAAVEAGTFDSIPPWGCFVTENSIPSTTWGRGSDAPVLFVLGEDDELVATTRERQTFATMCQQGYRAQFLECAGASHAQAAVWSLPEQREWLEARLAGTPMDAATTCTLADPVHCSAQSE